MTNMRSTVSLCAGLAFAATAAASAAPVLVRSGTALDDEILDGLRASPTQLVVVGYENGVGGRVEAWPHGAVRAFVEARNLDGTVAWRHVIDTDGVDVAESVLQSRSGEIIVAGRTTGALPGFRNQGSMDAFVVAFAADGSVRAATQFGDERPQHPRALVEQGGTLVVVGYDDIHIPTNYVADWENATVHRLPYADGAFGAVSAWRSRAAASDAFVDAAVGADGHLFVLEHNRASSSRGGGTFVHRWNRDDKPADSAVVSRSPLDVGQLLLQSEADLIVVGSALTGLGGVSTGASQAFAMRFDAALDRRWATQLPSDHPAWVAGAQWKDDALTAIAVATHRDDFGVYPPRIRSVGASFDAGTGALSHAWQSPESSAAELGERAFFLDGACDAVFAASIAGPSEGTAEIGGLDAVIAILPKPGDSNCRDGG